MLKKFNSGSHILTAAICLGILSPAPAMAGTTPASLSIISEEPDEAAQSCGITKAGNLASIRSALRFNRIDEAAFGSTDAYVYVKSNTMKIGSVCVTSYSVAIQSLDYRALNGIDNPVIGNFVYCEQGGLMSGPNHYTRLSESYKVVFELCLSDIANYATAK